MNTVELIKNDALTESEIIQLREAFVAKYCANKGWDKENLSFEEILEIRGHSEWKAPGMMKS